MKITYIIRLKVIAIQRYNQKNPSICVMIYISTIQLHSELMVLLNFADRGFANINKNKRIRDELTLEQLIEMN